MASYCDNIDRWIQHCLYDGTKPNLKGKIIFHGDRIYSYGTHFEMARVLRDRKGDATAFLINGDRWGQTTDRHQREVRSAIARTSKPRVIIPYSALDSAGVTLDSIEIIEVTKDRRETKQHVSLSMPEGACWVEEPIRKHVELPSNVLAERVATKNAKEVESFEMKRQWAQQGLSAWKHLLAPDAKPREFTIDDLQHYERHEVRTTGTERVLYKNHRVVDVAVNDNGQTEYRWETSRHWLGESLIRAKVPRPMFTSCKTCAGTGRTYPGAPKPAKRCDSCDGLGGRRWRRNRNVLFLSGFDHNEYPRNVYFLCELPRGAKPTTVAEAYEALKPEAVQLAEQMGRSVHRQGDIFTIELRGVTKRQLRAQGARFEKRGQLFGTNHEATETAYLPNGTTLVRGTLWHNPAWRGPDHRRVTVGKSSWHIAIKNTVPIAA